MIIMFLFIGSLTEAFSVSLFNGISHPCRRTAVIPFNRYLGDISIKENINSTIGLTESREL